MPKTAFVTGGTGFLGRHIIEQLSAQGWHVVALHRPTSDVRDLKTYPGELRVGSITDARSIERAMPPQCDAVFHVAANTSMWSGHAEEQTRENVLGTRIMVQAALDKEARRFVHTSSVAAWGATSAPIFDETAKSHALESTINYERTKYLGELEVEKGIARGLRAVIMNPGHVLGRYDKGGWARMFSLVHTGKLMGVPPGGGTWAHAPEVALAHIAAVEYGRVGERYLLGGADATYKDVIYIIGHLTGKTVPSGVTPLWVMRTYARMLAMKAVLTNEEPHMTPEIVQAMARPIHHFRSDKAIRELGYRPALLPEMLRDTFEWLKAEKLLG